ncbi:MAG: hypothetical protein IPM81_13545 [Saprospirales bacterium]|nr:hypothetical protein [Saprospirales bacterium]
MPHLLARFFSILGHPMLVPSYALLLLLYINPFAFGVHSPTDKQALFLLMYVFTTTALIPGIGIAVMKPLGFVKSLESPDRLERVGPYIVTGVFYLWLYKNLSAGDQAPALYLVCVLGATIGLFMAFFINIFTKISAHATGMGGLVGMLLLTAWQWPGSMLGLPVFGGSVQVSLVAAAGGMAILAGCVGTARLALEVHSTQDIWQGYLVGFLAVWVANGLL